jgi:peptidoglycan endopeptidase LytE
LPPQDGYGRIASDPHFLAGGNVRVALWIMLPVLLAVLGVASFACSGGSDEDPASVDAVYPTATLPAELPDVVIVSGTPQATPGGDDGRYVIQEGDTLSSIADRFNVSLEELIAVNNIVDPTGLHAGDEIVIPGSSATAEPDTSEEPLTDPTEPAVDEEPTEEPTSESAETTYTIQDGDTPASIAAQFGITPEELMEANGITDPTSLLVGDVLTIPGP